MRRTSFEHMSCSIAQTLEVVGDWWTLLVVRDLLLGITRFDDLQERLGIARNVLSDRLGKLVDAGIADKVPYQERPERYDYVLTEKGKDLWRVVTAMREWGDRWAAPDGPPVQMLHRTCGHVATIVPTCSECGESVERAAIRMVPGPGARPSG